jgi:hypothetical protein
MNVTSGNGKEFFWGFVTARETVSHVFQAPNMRSDVSIFTGPPLFEADQIGRLLDFKVPPLAKCGLTPRQRLGPIIQYDEEVTPLGLKTLKQHLLSWNLEGTILKAPQVTTWWIPYNLEAIMSYGHSVNSAIPENPSEAEFPPTPWPDEVTIRIKSRAPPQIPSAPLPVGGAPLALPAPGSPSGWQGPALGQSDSISADASGLTDYSSPYSARTVEGQREDPTDEELLRLRGEARRDEDVHQMISWTTRKDYALMVGIGLPVPDLSIERFHEAQLWEETDEEWVISENHAEFVYAWLMNRLTLRSTQRFLPVGMPESIDEVTVITRKDGKAGYIHFVPSDLIASPETKVLIEYDHGYMLEGTENAYTIRMISNDFMSLTQNTWELYPAFGYRQLIDGTIVHKCTTDYRTGQQILAEDATAVQPARVLEERGRGIEIHSITDQGRLS